jgi:hypothetical protein
VFVVTRLVEQMSKKALVGNVLPPMNLKIFAEKSCNEFFDEYAKYAAVANASRLVKIPLVQLLDKKLVPVINLYGIASPIDDVASEENFIKSVKAYFAPKSKFQGVRRFQEVNCPKLLPNTVGRTLLVQFVADVLEAKETCGLQIPDKKVVVQILFAKIQKAAPPLYDLAKANFNSSADEPEVIKTFLQLVLEQFDVWEAASEVVQGSKVSGGATVSGLECVTCRDVGRRSDHTPETCWLLHPELKKGPSMKEKLVSGRVMSVEAVSNNDPIATGPGTGVKGPRPKSVYPANATMF